MVLTRFQREICHLLADRRRQGGESYFAGGSTLNELLGEARISRDIDLFHDTEEAVGAAFEADRAALRSRGCEVEVVRSWRGFVQAKAVRGAEAVLLEWARDSSYRFFPLLEHADLGLVLHPFDLATNKVLALVGRLEPRDWIDVIACDRRLQPLGFLAWAACGKDPGFGPAMLLEHAARNGRYSEAELSGLDFAGEPPDAGALSRRWREILDRARRIVELLPENLVGRCVLGPGDELCRLDAAELPAALDRGELRFHSGSIGGALPSILPA